MRIFCSLLKVYLLVVGVSVVTVGCNNGSSNSEPLSVPFAIKMESQSLDNQLPTDIIQSLFEYEDDVIEYMDGILNESPTDRTKSWCDINRSEVEIKNGNTTSGLFGAVTAATSGIASVVQNDMFGTVRLGMKKDGITSLTSSMSDEVKNILQKELVSIESACQFSSRSKLFKLYYDSNTENVTKKRGEALNDNPSPKLSDYPNLMKSKILIDYVEDITLKKLACSKVTWKMRYWLVRNHNDETSSFLSEINKVLNDQNARINTGNSELDESITNLRLLISDLSSSPDDVEDFLKFASEETKDELLRFKRETISDIESYFLDI